MRIISGSRRGKKLFSAPGLETRPTSDRIKESIFNILSSIEPDTVLLDLFAGTGALALEALSRGAAYAVLIDNSKTAVKVIERNIQACGFEGRSTVKIWDALANLNCLVGLERKFNLIFMDPPYGNSAIIPVIVNLIKSNAMACRARIVVEHGIGDSLQNLPEKIMLDDQRRYGKTLVSFLSYMI